MIQNYLKIAIRSLMRNKVYSFINIFGLAVGMTASIYLFLWVAQEFRTNQSFKHIDRLYIAQHQIDNQGKISRNNSTSEPLAVALGTDYAEVEAASRLDYKNQLIFEVNGLKQHEMVKFADRNFFSLFDFEFISGSAETAFAHPFSIVLNETTAKKLFGQKPALGQEIKIQSKLVVQVTAVIKDLGPETSLNFSTLMDWNAREALDYYDYSDHPWTNSYVQTFVLLRPGTDPVAFGEKIKSISKDHDAISYMDVYIYPFSRMYLYNKFENGLPSGGHINQVLTMLTLGVIILLLACINFMNLTTAASEKRAKEVGIRKVSGSSKLQLVCQFLVESILITSLASLLAFCLVLIFRPAYESLIHDQLIIPFQEPKFWILYILFTVSTGLLAGAYPAFYISSFSSIRILKGTFVAPKSLFAPKRILVIFQFSCAMVLLTGTIFIVQQIKYASSRNEGYEKDQLLTVFIDQDAPNNQELIRQKLIDEGVALSITKTGSPMSRSWSNSSAISWPGKDPNDRSSIYRFAIDRDWSKTTGVRIIAGRDLDNIKFPSDSTSMILNQAAVKKMQLQEPVIGTIIEDNFIQWTVVGIVEDFIINSPYQEIEPLIIAGAKSHLGLFTIKLNPAHKPNKNLENLNRIFKSFGHENPLIYEFVDESYRMKFIKEQNLAELISYFSAIAILISCLGLLGLVAFSMEQRKKEIGIRKVIGASNFRIFKILSAEYMKLILIAITLGIPICIYITKAWLESNFTYRIQLSFWVFLGTAVGIICLALLTAGLQALKTIYAKPIDSLRDE